MSDNKKNEFKQEDFPVNEINDGEVVSAESDEESAEHSAGSLSGGFVADTFDREPDLPKGSDIQQSGKETVERTDGIKVIYGFKADEVKTALRIFQRNTIYRKNIIYSLIIAVLLGIYLISVIGGSDSRFNLFMCVLCFTVLLMIWYFPLNHVRQIVKALRKEAYKEEFSLTVYPDSMEIGECDGKSMLNFEHDFIRVWETEQLFIIGQDKYRVFVVPKRCTGVETRSISQRFQDGLYDRYKLLALEK